MRTFVFTLSGPVLVLSSSYVGNSRNPEFQIFLGPPVPEFQNSRFFRGPLFQNSRFWFLELGAPEKSGILEVWNSGTGDPEKSGILEFWNWGPQKNLEFWSSGIQGLFGEVFMVYDRKT